MLSLKSLQNCEEFNIVEVRRAVKSYGRGKDRKIVLNGLDMNVEAGSIYALIGASGCGKTTLLSTFAGMNSLDRGKIKIFGEYQSNTLVNGLRVSLMPQEISLHEELTVDETLYFFGNVCQMDEKLLSEKSEMLKKLLELPSDDRKICDCSGGEKRRVSFAVTMIHDPELLILDEPTVGLDPILRETIWNFMLNLTRQGKHTFIITTHYIEEAAQADRCGLMRNGILLMENSPSMIKEQNQCQSLEQAFLQLCIQSEDIVNETIDDETQEDLITINRKADKRRRKYFHRKTLKALIYKSYIQVIRQPMAIFIIFSSLFMALGFYYAIGNNPRELRVGIVSDEIVNYEDCYNSSLVTFVLDAEKSCALNLVSCRFIRELSKADEIKMEFYQKFNQAYDKTKQGKLIAVIHFKSNFSKSTERIIHHEAIDDDEENVLANREIAVIMDRTDYQSSYFLQNKLLDVYKSYSSSLNRDCNISDKIDASPINFMQPIYGETDINYRDHIGPISFMVVLFFGCCINTITNFIDDRKNGAWNRTLLTGVEMSEFLFAHCVIHGLTTIFQVTANLILLFYFFPQTLMFNFTPIFLLFLLMGFCGLLCGILIGCNVDAYLSAGLSGSFVGWTTFIISGILWPIESMSKWIRVTIEYLVLICVPGRSLNSYIYKGTGSFAGIITLTIWCMIFIIISYMILKSRKFSK